MSPHPQVSVGATEQKHAPRSNYDAGWKTANRSVLLIPSTTMGNDNTHDFWEEKLSTKISQSPRVCAGFTQLLGYQVDYMFCPMTVHQTQWLDCITQEVLAVIHAGVPHSKPQSFRYQRAKSAGTRQAFHTYVYIHYLTMGSWLSIASYTLWGCSVQT